MSTKKSMGSRIAYHRRIASTAEKYGSGSKQFYPVRVYDKDGNLKEEISPEEQMKQKSLKGLDEKSIRRLNRAIKKSKKDGKYNPTFQAQRGDAYTIRGLVDDS